MALTKQAFTAYIKDFNFRELFNDMSWNNDKSTHPIVVDEVIYTLKGVAGKSGFKILLCNPTANGLIPDYSTRKKIETKVTKLFQEHRIIFFNAAKTEQIWQLVVRQSGKPTKVTETRYHTHQDTGLLFQRAAGIFFELDEEENITIVDVTKRVADNFHQNNEKVTKQFYEKFKKEHTAFLAFINGIDDKLNKDWYASLMLNRLMFCYFIQKKGFLNNDQHYLRNKLAQCKAKKGQVKFYSFYRDFLLVLFHQGLNEPEQQSEVKIEIGRIPYLNGGLFDEHQLEKDHKHIDIDDIAFERLFDFFDEWEWHLDTREEATGKDINPDVIGYIFEKYINDRANMGAYYTKEDITDYISKNCILPYLFDETKRNCPDAFKESGELWTSVKNSEDKYIYEAVKHGIKLSELGEEELEDGRIEVTNNPTILESYESKFRQLPPEIAVGITDVSKRTEWNKQAPESFALPTEIWREVVERRNRYTDVRGKIENGEITGINDFITYNLNIRQFAQDAIQDTNNPEFLHHFYKALNTVTIIDPTCGSGAFLFAAMNILEPLYESCLQRMRNFVEEEDRANSTDRTTFRNSYQYFREVLQAIQNEQHPNQQYFIYKSIILRNLYGVDIMKEAVEIAKLRLFLKLVATVDADYHKHNLGLEPLPDIDFNIRAGNTLVGFATEAELNKAFEGKMDFTNDRQKLEESCQKVANAFSRYKEIQLDNEDGYPHIKEAKVELNTALSLLNDKLNLLLAEESGVSLVELGLTEHKDENLLTLDNPKIPESYKSKFRHYLTTHQPFHWFAEYYEIIQKKGGFDVIIGNPPYVVYNSASFEYKLKNFETLDCKDLYAYVIERSSKILNLNGGIGMIVPISIVSTDGFESLRKLITQKLKSVWYSSYAMRPAKLFDGVEKHLSILLANHTEPKNIFSSKYYRWYSENRDYLFQSLQYTQVNKLHFHNDSIPKVGTIIETSILKKIKTNQSISSSTLNFSKYIVYHTRKLRYFLQFLDKAPIIYESNGAVRISSELKEIYFKSEEDRLIANATYLSSLFFWYYVSYSDCRNLNKREVSTFPFSIDLMESSLRKKVVSESNNLISNLHSNSYFLDAFYKKYGSLKMQVFQPRLSKPIIDEIDKVLAEHYGFTDEELDFIINYDIKYRMGRELEEDV